MNRTVCQEREGERVTVLGILTMLWGVIESVYVFCVSESVWTVHAIYSLCW